MMGRSSSPRGTRSTRYESERQQKSERARSHYARIQHRKATRSQRRALRAAAFALALGAGFAAGNGNSQAWLAQFESPSQSIERISVLGNRAVAPLEIAQQSGIERGVALDSVDLAEATSRIGSHPWVREARLRRLPGGEILAIVRERSPIAAIQSSGSATWHAVDSDGTVFAEIDLALHPDLLRLRSDDAASRSVDVTSALELAQRLNDGGVARPTAIVLPTRESSDTEQLALGWRLVLADGGPEVVLGEHPTSESVARLAELLQARLDAVRSAERIDLRFRDRAILRAAEEPAAKSASTSNPAHAEAPRGGDETACADVLGGRPISA